MDTKAEIPVVGEVEASFDLRLTATEADQLAGLIDIAVKAAGIRVASAALVFMHRLQAGLKNAIVPASGVPAASPLIRGK